MGSNEGSSFDAALTRQDSLSNTTAESDTDETTNTEPNSACSTNSNAPAVRQRPQRMHTLSVIGRESKISAMNVAIIREINGQFKFVNQTQAALAEGVHIDELMNISDDLAARSDHVRSMHDELISLHGNKDEINGQINSMFNQYITTTNNLMTVIEGNITSIQQESERETQEAIKEANREIEEQARIFQELLRQRGSAEISIIIRNPTGSTNRDEPLTRSTSQPMAEGQQPATAVSQPTQDGMRQSSSTSLQTVASNRDLGSATQTRARTRSNSTETGASTPQQTTEIDMVSRMAQSIAEAIGSRRKTVEPDTFDGNVLQFADWEIDFDEYLQAEGITGHARLRHMKKYLAGDARTCIEGHFSTNTSDAYLAARATLKERYGNEQRIARRFRDKLDQWPKLPPRDGQCLRDYSDFLSHLESAMSRFSTLSILDDCIENEKMVAKLPNWMKIKWGNIIAKTNESENRYPTFSEFCKFVKAEAQVAMLPIFQTNPNSQAKTEKEREHFRKPGPRIHRTYQTVTETPECRYCSKPNHLTRDCYRIQEKSKADKEIFIRKSGLCFKCFEYGHRSRECKCKLRCMICTKNHATANHDPQYSKTNSDLGSKMPLRSNKEPAKPTNKPEIKITPSQQTSCMGQQQTVHSTQQQKTTEGNDYRCPEDTTNTADLNCNSTALSRCLTSMAVPVYVSTGTGKELLVYALLDSMSDACYASREVLSKLKAEASKVENDVTIHTINGATTQDIKRYDNVRLRGYLTDSSAEISVYERESIHGDKDQMPTTFKARELEHLKDIAEHLPPDLDIPIGLLIGTDHPEIIQPLETRPAPTGKPFGIRTLFGWTMCGGRTDHIGSAWATHLTHKPNTTQNHLLSLLERDFKDVDHDGYMSQEELRFMKILESSTEKTPSGNYIMPLPFKLEPELPNNRPQAEKRLYLLLKKLGQDADYEEYNQFIKGMVEAGHAELAPTTTRQGKVWYLPHFAVRHKQKRKLRVVFDASAKFKGIAINDCLLSGPDHINSLLGILLRFRKEPIAITCDVQQMFYNFLVTPQHRDYLRFLWVDDEGNTKDYRMTAHLFGAKSSPGVATFGLRKVAESNSTNFPEAARFLKEDFYVDDGVTSVATPDQAKHLISTTAEICAKANIRLHKFLSNNKAVLAEIPESERAESTKTVDILKESLPNQRTLGMEWCVEKDVFKFSLSATGDKPTKRHILSVVARAYDPMGLISPFILKGKAILQSVTSEEKSWDDPISPQHQQAWQAWIQDLQNLASIEIPRCLKAEERVIATELHHFGDASQVGYGACSYLRQITNTGRVKCNLVLAKSRVAPLKKLTIPRLELQGALTAVRLARTLRKELKMEVAAEYFWTDSQIVLGYINNDAKHFHVFVANRVAEIRRSSEPEQWWHVATGDNPADLASRGGTTEQLTEEQWFNGPPFLREASLQRYIDNNPVNTAIDKGDVEVKSTTVLSTSIEQSLLPRFTRYSDFKKLVKSIAILKTCVQRRRWKHSPVTLNHLQESEKFIIQETQRASYTAGKNSKCLTRLNPVVDDSGLLRVGGRAENALNWSHQYRHPLIIPRRSHLTSLIIRKYHGEVHHLGHRSTLAAIRDAGYWIVNGSGAVKSHLIGCILCKKIRARPASQQMGELPTVRLEQTPPFTHVGIDVFGPFRVKDRRTEAKRWGLVLTCLYSRAIHIEILEEMTTDCLILALRCFLAIRGPVRTILCDNGTNFVGMRNELAKQLELTEPKVKEFLMNNNTEMIFNPPKASHQGGATERMIRSIRAVLNSINLKYSNRMDTKTLRTVLCEVTNIVNSRPLTGTSLSDPNDELMTPNRLLTLKTLPLPPPPGSFSTEDVYSRKRWRVSQAIAEEFWQAWKTEYIGTLMTRQKWQDKQNNVKVGDIVLLEDESAFRSEWKIGKVTEVKPGKDGLVRNVVVQLGNRHLDSKGHRVSEATTLRRSIHKLVVLISI